MAFIYYLPDKNGNKIEYGIQTNAVIIIGANGSGKSKLGAWIERQNMEDVHRIGAQRKLNFSENIPLKSYSQAENFVFYGSSEAQPQKGQRWDWGQSYTTKLMEDFENVLAALIALSNMENEKFINECKTAEKENRVHPHTPYTAIDKLIDVWDEIFPQRHLKYFDGKFSAVMPQDESKEYSSNQMSDGERAVLYLASQVLCVPENKTLIIDEPEIHLHRSIMNRLWVALENHRPDCLFIYITHDTQFAAMHGNADKIWIKEFDGQNWIFEKVESSELPEELLLDILGNRRNVLFVEGEKNSYDTQLYSALYPDYYVIACGSCTQVIARTKAFRNNPSVHHCQMYGIIDRDYRSDYEIEKYKENGIYTIAVAEVENLFLVEELIKLMATHMGQSSEDAEATLQKIKNCVIQKRYAKQIERQICQSVVANLKYQLNSAELSTKDEDSAKESLEKVIESLNYEETKKEQESRFRVVLEAENYSGVLRVFNEKSIVGMIGEYLGLKNDMYCSTVLALMNGQMHDEIVNALTPYLPTEIPR